MRFCSHIYLKCISGNGGSGIVAWRRESHIEFGGPYGGSGGKGGDVYIVGDPNINSLFYLRNVTKVEAQTGQPGANKAKTGKDGEDKYVRVPFGTVIFEHKDHIIAEILDEIPFLLCAGGKGGRGNFSFKSNLHPAPTLFEKGDKGQCMDICLELRCVADIGLLGYPNAGKSSFLTLVSNAKPKVDSFPFTTLVPVLGSVNFHSETLVFADIPGLIDGSSSGKGLGHDFLKHLSRCGWLIHIIDISETDPIQNFLNIELEVQKYNHIHLSEQRIVLLNKIDLLSEIETNELVKRFQSITPHEILTISAKHGTNVDFVLKQIFSKKVIPAEPISKMVQLFDPPKKELIITHTKGVWNVQHPSLEYWVYKIPRTTIDNTLRLSKKLQSLKVKESLLRLGVKKGELVKIYDWCFNFLEE